MKPLKVVLIGPMGAGKTTLGTLLSKELNWPYFDNDLELETINNLSPKELSNLSVPELHVLESQFLATLMRRDSPFISSAAASVVDYPVSVELLREATAIYLRLPLEKLLKRAGSTGIGRQALHENAALITTERFNRRDPVYRSVAKLTIELSQRPTDDAAAIITYLKI